MHRIRPVKRRAQMPEEWPQDIRTSAWTGGWIHHSLCCSLSSLSTAKAAEKSPPVTRARPTVPTMVLGIGITPLPLNSHIERIRLSIPLHCGHFRAILQKIFEGTEIDPAVEHSLGNTHLAADLSNWNSNLVLFQGNWNLGISESRSFHGKTPF